MEKTATIDIDGKKFECPVLVGTEDEHAIDIRKFRSETGYITYDDGYANTGSCTSDITYIDGEKGILRYRGYPIEELADQSSFMEVAWLVIYGELPSRRELEDFREKIRANAHVHESLKHHFEGFPATSHPMAVLSSMLNAIGCFYPQMVTNNPERDLEFFDDAAALLMSKVRTLAAMAFRNDNGLPYIYPKRDLRYAENFLHMMFSEPYSEYRDISGLGYALDLFLLLHADHEQNCSTSTVRMVASGGANLFASVAAGVCALWGPLHGGANTAVVQMLESIHRSGDDGTRFIEKAKSGESRMMGFGHRVYKNYDPRAKILGAMSEKVLASLGVRDPLLDIAKRLEEAALHDDYFISRKLYPNVDFYSGIILRAVGIPLNMFTVMFAIGRMPGWIANWREIAEAPKRKIHRPRQVYMGKSKRKYIDLEER